jgi:hypothetical protein
VTFSSGLFPSPNCLLTGFADFAGAPDPSPVPVSPSGSPNLFQKAAQPTLTPSVPFTKWYRVWERTSLSDFYGEAIIFPFMIFVIVIHVWGLRTNKKRAHDWARHHVPALEFEFAQVGFEKSGTADSPESAMQQNTSSEWVSYASGRSNVAFVDFRLTLTKRYNPLVILGENLLGIIFESLPPTVERMESTAYAFDNKEPDIVPHRKDQPAAKAGNSGFDGFVWAVVHKRMLKKLREDRYDLSLTTTKDNPKLPAWTTVMSENAEITETLLTPELIKAIEDCGDLFDALVISDQPLERPTKSVIIVLAQT